MLPDSQRVVMTGLGLVTPLGCRVEVVWRRMLAGASGVRRLPDAIVPDVLSKVAGVVPDLAEDPEAGFDAEAVGPARERRKMDRFIQFAIGAADAALAQAGWRPETERARQRTATVMASALGGLPAMLEAGAITAEAGVRRLSPFTIPAALINLAAGQVSLRHGLQGPIGAPATACAASLQAIGDAARLIRAGEADVAVAGGAEACIGRVELGAFAAARALSTAFNASPALGSRPFDRDRDGFVMGEGAGMVVLERLDHARARGAEVLAEVLGYGSSADAHHSTAAPPDGEGAQRAMRLALAQAGLPPEAIDYVSAHATSTPLGDASELAALGAVFGERGGPAISATKSAIGHLCGAAGAVAAVVTTLALRDGVIPPTLNLAHPAPATGLDLVGPVARAACLQHALINGFGFGGVNASLVLGRWDDAA
ncbi:MAG: beta-ketoacyl-ACP synthase [Thermomicrobiales bacterium]